MKVYINDYRDHWLSPYTILKWIYRREIDYDDPTIEKWADRIEPFSKFLQKLLDIIHPRIVYVKVDNFDTWNMDSTLSPIILPMLKQLRTTTHGSQFVDLEDVPEHMRTTKTEDYDSQLCFEFYKDYIPKYDIHDRWKWVLDEMIFAFDHLVDGSWEDKYHTGEFDIQWKKLDNDMSEMVYGPNHTHVCDYVGLNAEWKRVDNGLRLFGKYYRGLWD